jgi:hypothetical protein
VTDPETSLLERHASAGMLFKSRITRGLGFGHGEMDGLISRIMFEMILHVDLCRLVYSYEVMSCYLFLQTIRLPHYIKADGHHHPHDIELTVRTK